MDLVDRLWIHFGVQKKKKAIPRDGEELWMEMV
jgi:hypothetical protein